MNIFKEGGLSIESIELEGGSTKAIESGGNGSRFGAGELGCERGWGHCHGRRKGVFADPVSLD